MRPTIEIPISLAQAIFAYFHLESMNHSNPDMEKCRSFALAIWKAAGHKTEPAVPDIVTGELPEAEQED